MPKSTINEKTGEIYVLKRFIGDRPVREKMGHNAERPDTDFFYRQGYYDAHPVRKKAYEKRRADEAHDRQAIQEWTTAALEALDEEKPIPPHTRDILVSVFLSLYYAEARGCTRPEIDRSFGNTDVGGKVSSALSNMHDAGVAFPLAGVRR